MDSEGGAKWDDLLKQSEEKNYADEQLANRNDVQSRWVLTCACSFYFDPRLSIGGSGACMQLNDYKWASRFSPNSLDCSQGRHSRDCI
jgi:hypothetical protein